MKALITVVAGGLLLAGGCATAPRDTLTQIATPRRLAAGDPAGLLSCRELSRYGDTGFGTLAGGGGELVLDRGRLYRVRADGSLAAPPPRAGVAFACVTAFESDMVLLFDRETPLPELRRAVDEALGDPEAPCAMRISGTFSGVRTAAAGAARRVRKTVLAKGTAVGFRLPSRFKEICRPGYSLYMLAPEAGLGGALEEAALLKGTVEIERCRRLHIVLDGAD